MIRDWKAELSWYLVLSGLLVDISLSVVAGLVDLVSDSVLGGAGAARKGCVAVFGNGLIWS
jgi:hypothetical protein